MSIEELKKIAYKGQQVNFDKVTDKWFVRCMSMLYLGAANKLIPQEEAKRLAAELEKDYNVLQLNRRIEVGKIACEIAKKLENEETVDFEAYPLTAEEWKEAGKIINKQMSLLN